MHDHLVRLTPKKAPFRRAGIHFKTLDPVVMPSEKLTSQQAMHLIEEPLVDVDVSRDGGEHWRRFTMPPETPAPRATDAAHSSERAIDPSGPIVPRAPIESEQGAVVPPEAADPAVPVAPARGDVAGADAAEVADTMTNAADVVGTEAAGIPAADTERTVGHEGKRGRGGRHLPAGN